MLAAAFLGTLGLVIADYRSDSSPSRGGNPSKPGVQAKSGDALRLASSTQLQPLALPERPELAEPRGELFSPHSWQPPAPKVAPAPPPAPVAPPMPYRFAGKIVQGGEQSVMLSKGDLVFPVKEGETIDGAYRVESVAEDRITLVYLPLRQKATIPVASELPFAPGKAEAQAKPPSSQQAAAQVSRSAGPRSAAPRSAGPRRASDSPGSAPRGEGGLARLHWRGPQKVRLGARFDVLLKLTSGQPLLASPMQLRFDPAYLELIGMKPGKYFGNDDRNFSYRASPDGSIYVGASNQNPVAAADAELLILTFKPLRTATAAELSMASLNLHGPAGRPIASLSRNHSRPPLRRSGLTREEARSDLTRRRVATFISGSQDPDARTSSRPPRCG